MYVRYLNGTVIELVKAKYTKTLLQNVDVSQVPLTDVSIVRRLGLKWQEWVISGAVTLTSSVMWRDIAQVSLDNVSWRNCVTVTVDFPRILIDQTLYELRLNVSPLLEGAAVRYPTTGYKWGNQSITGISQAGNVNTHPTIHYLAPLFYAPLSNTLIDFAGQSVTFTRTAAKYHGGILYPINTPIFDSGLYLGTDTVYDMATWTPPASAVRTVALQIKSKYPSAWSIGGDGVNLITPNQSNAATDTTGMEGDGGTLTRNTVNPLAGAADFKLVATSNCNLQLHMARPSVPVAVTAGCWYYAQALVKSVAAAGRQCSIWINWYTAANAEIGWGMTGNVDCSTASVISIAALAPATAAKAFVYILMFGALTGEIIHADNFEFEAILMTQHIWAAALNKMWIQVVDGWLGWYDDTYVVGCGFPWADYLAGKTVDIVVTEDTAHSVTIACHAAGGAWTTETGTLAALAWPQLTLGSLEGSIANLVEFPYVLTSAEYQALVYSSLSLLFNALYIGNRYAGTIVKGSDGRLVNANGSDISALLGGTDIAISSAAVTIAKTQGLSARWYVEVARTDV